MRAQGGGLSSSGIKHATDKRTVEWLPRAFQESKSLVFFARLVFGGVARYLFQQTVVTSDARYRAPIQMAFTHLPKI